MELIIENAPDFQDGANNIFISRIQKAVDMVLRDSYPDLRRTNNTRVIELVRQKTKHGSAAEEKEEKGAPVSLQEPRFAFDQIILEDSVMKELQYAIHFEQVRDKVYNEWGLCKIDPFPKLALNFHGPSGTGKTMAAHALASKMGKKILLASYAEIESKYVGDGPKNVKKLFQFASENNAVLFIDEADSLLSKRLTNIEHGSEQSINSMRSQLLIEIEKYSGIVIFATNLAENYDSAFKTRIRSIAFKKPDKTQRRLLWQTMLPPFPPLPLAKDIDFDKLADIEDVCGRDIKNAVIKAAIVTAIEGQKTITQQTLEDAITGIIASNEDMEPKVQRTPVTGEEKKRLEVQIKEQLKQQPQTE